MIAPMMERVRRVRRDPRFFYRPHAAQQRFHALGGNHHERLFLAGNRVGKTMAGAVEMTFHLTGLYPAWWQGARYDRPVQAWAASVTREATRDILQAVYFDPMHGVLPKWLVAETSMRGGVTGAIDTVQVTHASGGMSMLGFKSYDQGRASFQGTVRDVVHLDEEPDIGIYEECLMRTLTVQGHVLLTMTPLLGLTEMVRHFTAVPEGIQGRGMVQAGWRDAGHLDGDAVARLRQSLRPHEVQAREFGIPQLGRGRVFPVEEAQVACARFEIPAGWRRCFGLDFGWSNPTAAVWLAYDAATDTVYVTEVYAQSEATPQEHAREIIRQGAWIPGVCDPAGQAANQRDGVSLMNLYAQAGVRLDSADNDVEAGLMVMLERMRNGKLKVFDDLLPWWHEFRQYGRDSRGKIIKRDDHLLDATRYALMSGLALARCAAPKAVVRGPVQDWRYL